MKDGERQTEEVQRLETERAAAAGGLLYPCIWAASQVSYMVACDGLSYYGGHIDAWNIQFRTFSVGEEMCLPISGITDTQFSFRYKALSFHLLIFYFLWHSTKRPDRNWKISKSLLLNCFGFCWTEYMHWMFCKDTWWLLSSSQADLGLTPFHNRFTDLLTNSK